MSRVADACDALPGGPMMQSRFISGAAIVIGILSAAALAFSWLVILAFWDGLYSNPTAFLQWMMVAAVASMVLCIAVLMIRAFTGGLYGWLVIPTGLVGAGLGLYGLYFVATEKYDWPLFVPAVTLGASLLFLAIQAYQFKRGAA